MAISKRKRFEVFKRDGFTCQYCGKTPPEAVLEVDHVQPVSKGGTDDKVNLLTACFDCNRGKGAVLLAVTSASVTDAQRKEMERHEQIKAMNLWLAKVRKEEDSAVERVSRYFCEAKLSCSGQTLSVECKRSVRVFLRRMPEVQILNAIDLAFARQPTGEMATFKYFCGICWKIIKGGAPHG